MIRLRRAWCAAALVALSATSLPACGTVGEAVPECKAGPRLGLAAQSVPEASYVPCLRQLPEGWSAGELDVRRGTMSFRLFPNRTGGRPVEVKFQPACDVSDAIPTAPRAEGVRTSIRLTTVSPRYSGTLTDVFPGGCVTYRFDFARGPHIAFMEDLATTVDLFSRRQLRLDLQRELGVELDP